MRELETSPSEIERFLICPGCANERRRGGTYDERTAEGMFIHEVVEQAVSRKRRSVGATLAQLRDSRQREDRALYAFAIGDKRPALISMASKAREEFLRFMEESDLSPVGEPEGEYTLKVEEVRLIGRYDVKLNGHKEYVVDLKMAVDLQSVGDNVQMAITLLGLSRWPILFDVSKFEAYGGKWNKKWLRSQLETLVLGVTELKRHHYSSHWCGRGDVGRGLFGGMDIATTPSGLDKVAARLRESAREIVANSRWQKIWPGFH